METEYDSENEEDNFDLDEMEIDSTEQTRETESCINFYTAKKNAACGCCIRCYECSSSLWDTENLILYQLCKEIWQKF